jgi:hypothetical protein
MPKRVSAQQQERPMTARRLILALFAASTMLTTAAHADGYRGEWRGPGWHAQDWRLHEWRERAWREREWRERHRPYGVYRYGPPNFAFAPPAIVLAPRW